MYLWPGVWWALARCDLGPCWPGHLVVVHSLSHVRLFLTPFLTAAPRFPCPSPSPGVCSNSCPLMPSNHLILCPPLPSCPQSFPASGSFSRSWLFMSRGPEYWSFSLSSSNESSALTSFRIDWFDLLAVQGTLKSLLQHHHGQVNLTLHTPLGSRGVTLLLSWKKWSR